VEHSTLEFFPWLCYVNTVGCVCSVSVESIKFVGQFSVGKVGWSEFCNIFSTGVMHRSELIFIVLDNGDICSLKF
jgi:hypothetical protein